MNKVRFFVGRRGDLFRLTDPTIISAASSAPPFPQPQPEEDEQV